VPFSATRLLMPAENKCGKPADLQTITIGRWDRQVIVRCL
jgi:hypothetical protein